MDNSHEFFDRYGERTLEKLLGMASGYVYNFTDSTLGSFFADLNVDIHGEKYRSAGKPMAGTPDIPALTKETLKELKLVPEGIPDSARGSDITKRLLQNLGTIGNNLAELRGPYGTEHGKHGKTEGLTARHAKLAVGAASTLATFLFDTHKETPFSEGLPAKTES